MKKLILSYSILSILIIAAFILGTIFFADIRYPLWYSLCCFAIGITELVIIAPFTIKLIKISHKPQLTYQKPN